MLDTITNRGVYCFNAGVSGNHRMHMIDILLNKVIAIRPKYAVLMENVNDWSTLFYEGTYWNDNPSRSLLVDPQSKRQIISGDEFYDKRNSINKSSADSIRNEALRAQQLFISVCRIYGIQPILMTQASRYGDNLNSELKQQIDAAMKKCGQNYAFAEQLQRGLNMDTRKLAEQQNTLLIDLDSEMPAEEEYFYDVVHFNRNGSIKAAEIISNKLEIIIAK
jgi:hypothetical protein